MPNWKFLYNPVIRILQGSDIQVTALHYHMLDDERRSFFLHFWANDDLARLAAGSKATLYRIALRSNAETERTQSKRRGASCAALSQESLDNSQQHARDADLLNSAAIGASEES